MSAPFVLDRPDIVFQTIADTLCAVFPTIGREALLSSMRINHTTAWVRQVGMYVMSGRLQITQTLTGRFFERDRTTVIHAVQLCEQEAAASVATAAFFDFIEGLVRAALDEKAAHEAELGDL